MAISRSTSGAGPVHPGAFGYTLWQLFSHIEDRVLVAIGQATGRALPNQNTLMHLGDQQQALSRLTRAVNDIQEGLDFRATRLAAESVMSAARQGRVEAVREIEALANRTDLPEIFRRRLGDARAALTGSEEGLRFGPVARIAEGLQGRLGQMRLPIVRAAQDSFQEITARAAAAATIGVDAQRKAAASAYQDLADRGLTAFVDKAGRRWSLDSYVDMATRTAIVQAAVESHNDQLGRLGIDLVIVSDSPRECPLCRPWEGKVLARTGPGGAHDVRVEHGIEDGQMVTVHVAGSVADATGAGLFHPNCTHTIGAYIPGVTRPLTNTANPEGYAAQQQQRGLERRLRAAKRAREGLPEWADKAKLDARIKALGAQMDQHLTDNPELFRQRGRESVAQGLTGKGGPVKKALPRPTFYPDTQSVGSDELQDAARVIAISPDIERKALVEEAGEVGAPERITLPDGRVVFGKTNSSVFGIPAEQITDAEQLSGMVGQALGAPVPRLYRDGPVHLYTEWVSGRPGQSMFDDPDGNYTYQPDNDVTERLTYGRQGQRLGLLDMLTQNGDRHGGNWFAVGEEGSESLVGIDQGLTYTGHFYDPVTQAERMDTRRLIEWFRGASEEDRLSHIVDTQSGYFVDNWFDLEQLIEDYKIVPRGEHWTPGDVVEIRRRLQSMAPAFEHLRHGDWLEYSLMILDTLGQYASGTESIFDG